MKSKSFRNMAIATAYGWAVRNWNHTPAFVKLWDSTPVTALTSLEASELLAVCESISEASRDMTMEEQKIHVAAYLFRFFATNSGKAFEICEAWIAMFEDSKKFNSIEVKEKTAYLENEVDDYDSIEAKEEAARQEREVDYYGSRKFYEAIFLLRDEVRSINPPQLFPPRKLGPSGG